MSVPYRYVKGIAIGRDDTCALCAGRSTALVIDHCHAHGYARGMLCGKCNSRLGRLDSGAIVPDTRETFYLSNCPECRKAESIDSHDAHALRIGTIALAIAVQLNLTPRQAGSLALSLLHESESDHESEVAPIESKGESEGASLAAERGTRAARIRALIADGVTDTGVIRKSLAASGIALPSDRYIRRLVREAEQKEVTGSSGYM